MTPFTRPQRRIALASLIVIAVLLSSCSPAMTKSEPPVTSYSYEQTVRAPDFPAGLDWLNSDRPLQMADLRGKVVLLDFWTYGCINCIHVIPKLKDLEAKYGDRGLVVIGVHSAKFENEAATDKIRQAILRYGLEHPVANDHDFVVWKEYGIRAWPTMVLIDPEGYIVATKSGEGAPDAFDPIIGQLLESFGKRGLIDSTPLHLKLERDSVPKSLLSFPGKVLVDETGNRLFISDSGHNRVIILALDSGEVLDVIGSGKEGLQEGGYTEAEFNNPQGLALHGDTLYIADTNNHTIHAVDITTKQVSRIAGTGEQGGVMYGYGSALETALSSPWDLEFVNGRLFIAMAGPHQIWYYDPFSNNVGVWAGSGRENLIDGPRYLAAFAQPSGLTSDGGKRLYDTDPEASAVRAIELSDSGGVMTVVGQGLFDFGDKDGGRTVARLQHPLGIAWHDGVLYVADTYNNKIKRVVPEKYSATTYAGSGEEGHQDGALLNTTFFEPGGLDVAEDGTIYVADTNNNLIRKIDPASGEVSTVALKGLDQMPMPGTVSLAPEATLLPAQTLDPEGHLWIQMKFPEGYHLNPEGGMRVTVQGAEGTIDTPGVDFATKTLPFELPFSATVGKGSLTLGVQYFFCRVDNEGVCRLGSGTFTLPLTLETGGGDATIELEIMAP